MDDKYGNMNYFTHLLQYRPDDEFISVPGCEIDSTVSEGAKVIENKAKAKLGVDTERGSQKFFQLHPLCVLVGFLYALGVPTRFYYLCFGVSLWELDLRLDELCIGGVFICIFSFLSEISKVHYLC